MLLKLQEFLTGNNLYCSISNIFSQYVGIKTYYEQALFVMEHVLYVSPDRNLCYYRESIIQHMLFLCSQSVYLKELCHPKILMLQAYDLQFNTQYLDTLLTYMECLFNIAECARRLNLHYNTIKYRLEIIQTICKINYDDINEVTELLISRKIIKKDNQ